MTLTEAEINHLENLLLQEKEEGSYYGNKEQYYKRIDRLLKKLEQMYNKNQT